MPHIHLIGIGGSGLSAIARLLMERGYTVSGSDRQLSPLTRELSEHGALVYAGHAAEHIQGADVVVRSSAIPDGNPEVQAALARGIPVLKRHDFLGELMEEYLGIAVAGTHGKTTTSAMLAWVLTTLGQEPSYILGGVSKNLGTNAHAGKGRAFIIEADEYDRMFLGLRPDMIILTMVEHDHPDCYPTMTDYLEAFAKFVKLLRPGGLLLAGYDDPVARAFSTQTAPDCGSFTYGLDPQADYTATGLAPHPRGGYTFTATYRGKELAQITLSVPGKHNVCNALAVLGAAHQLNLDLGAAAEALGEFTGAGRRFDVLGEAQGVTIINDYAHHPTEIRATLAAARSRYPTRRIWAVWQPHTYSRTRTLLDRFMTAFDDADEVLVTDIYAAREYDSTFSAAQVTAQLTHPAAHFTPTLADATEYLLHHLQSGDVLLVLSAGDADKISQQVLDTLTHREVNHV
ncbi:MAG TPA: UDP-N-acetylmuramate--L-alanine ligase [Anaerolineaceae bacterium]|jgi:UDP-N-acetylmuramate--alanine ligase|nr:UDP-N-acetylmuramate--L-alanine ligase [Anaerolineaceae bacterium]